MMAHVVDAIVAFARSHTLLAYGLAFLLAGAESFPVLGALVPGTAVIVAFGALVPTGALHFWFLVLSTTLGAIVGDGLPYWLGHHYKERAGTIWPFRKRPGLVAGGEAFFARHGGKAILIARFTPGVRAVVPLVAGITGLPSKRFYTMNVLSAVIWAPAHVVMGVVIGESLTVLSAVAGRLTALGFVVFVLLVLIVWFTPRIVRVLGRLGARLHGPVQAWASARNTWMRRQILSVLDPNQTETRSLAVLGAVLISSLWLLFGALQDVFAGDPLVQANAAVLHLFQALRVEWIDRLAVAVLELGSLPVTLAVAVAAMVWLAARRAWRAAIYDVAAVVGALIFAASLALVLRQPAVGSAVAQGIDRMPGAQVAASVALYLFLAVLVARELGGRWGFATITGAVALAMSIALARLYLGADQISTVVVGTAFGMAWTTVLSIAYFVRASSPVRSGGLLAVVGLVFLAAGGVSIGRAQQSDLHRYAVVPTMRTMTMVEWERAGWATLPVSRLDLVGSYSQPFNVQWAGSLKDLAGDLEAYGWRPPVGWTLRSTLEWLSPQANAGSLPVLPRLESGRPEKLVLIRPDNGMLHGERLVLRLWQSGVVLTTGPVQIHLWLGSVATEKIGQVAWLTTITQDAAVSSSELRKLSAALPTAQIQYRTTANTGPNWDGSVLTGRATEPGEHQDLGGRRDGPGG